MALEGKAAELARALKDQEAKLKEEYLAEHESVMNEEVGKLTADYKAQLPGIRDKAWTLGWRAALKRVGVPTDSPIFQNSPRFPRSDSELHRAQDGWPSEQRHRAARVVLLPDPDMLMAVPPELVKAPSSGRLALCGCRAARVVLLPDPDAYGCAARAGEGTELRAVGPLNRGAEPRGWTVGPLNRGAELRGWYCYRTLMLMAVPPELVKAPSLGRHRAQDGWPFEQRRRAARVVLLPDPDVLTAVPPELVKAPSSGWLAL
ncbi:hypothetical protein AAC387_Pa02g1803 [Persea americana]